MANFKWLGRSTVTRSKDGSAGRTLETGHIYDRADFAEAIVAEWVATGNAEDVKTEATNTVLKVHSATVKSKTPKVGVEA